MSGPSQTRVLVAGLGNIFLGDDGFGVEVVRQLRTRECPSGVEVRDVGIRGVHLAFDLLERPPHLTVLVDALGRGRPPGSVYLFEPEAADATPPAVADAHAMTPEAVLAFLRSIGGQPGRVLVVGCEPASLQERIGLSASVSAAVPQAIALIFEILERELVPMS